MKKIVAFALALCAAAAALAQTPQEIISRMDDVMKQHQNDGISLIIDIKVPIVGSMSTKSYSVGDKSRVEMEAMGVAMISWNDDKTMWTYNGKDNTIEIKDWNPSEKSGSDGDVGLFTGITEGYDVSIKEENNDAWYLICKKKKTNKEKDDPKTMNLAVAKGTYHPISLSATASGISFTMRDISFGVPESLVTFNPADYPTAKIIDKRVKQTSGRQ